MIDKIAFLFWKNGKILSTRSIGKDAWYLPGGKREPGESDLECLVRELQEELDVDVRPEEATYLGTWEAQAHGKAEGVIVRMTCYTAPLFTHPRPAGEIVEIGWLDTSDMDRISPVDKLIFADLHAKGYID